MQKKDIIAELKKFETYKKFSDKQLERKTKATLEEMLRVAKENQPKIEYDPANVRLENGKIVGLPPDFVYIVDDWVDLAAEEFAKDYGLTKQNVLKKFEIIEKNGGKKLSNYDKMLCMGIDFGKFGIYK